MFPFPLRTTVFALSVLLHLSSIYVASGQSCGCTSIFISVHVDVLVPKDPADPFGGLRSNASSLRRLDDTYDVFGVFCQPNTTSPKNADVIQLLVPGFTYTSQYWSPPTEEFRSYSYTEFTCDRGLSSLAIDWVGVGLSSRPVNASDVQAQGSIMLNFGAIVDGTQSPFDGFILTSLLNVDLSTLAPLLGVTSARDNTLLRARPGHALREVYLSFRAPPVNRIRIPGGENTTGGIEHAHINKEIKIDMCLHRGPDPDEYSVLVRPRYHTGCPHSISNWPPEMRDSVCGASVIGFTLRHGLKIWIHVLKWQGTIRDGREGASAMSDAGEHKKMRRFEASAAPFNGTDQRLYAWLPNRGLLGGPVGSNFASVNVDLGVETDGTAVISKSQIFYLFLELERTPKVGIFPLSATSSSKPTVNQIKLDGRVHR
ncbi:hypothetical protein C8J57DRAFT_1251906 [Mycena rebaudengoi]|nr:hypothetical protein C8J57DRAFT_1251906 [Mycena rebaudengoi]